MLNIFKWCIIVGFMTMFSTNADNFSDVSLLINKRLSYMKDIAGFKAIKHLAIEDIIQEDIVLQKTSRRAKEMGLDEASVRSFIIAQINAAKAIQYRYRADWLAIPELGWQPRSLDELRPQIAMLSTELLVKLHALLINNVVIDDKLYYQFIKMVDQRHLSDMDKRQLFIALQTVKLSKDNQREFDK